MTGQSKPTDKSRPKTKAVSRRTIKRAAAKKKKK